MGKDRALDACRKAVSTALLVAVVFWVSSCSLPHIAVLHDPLTPEEHVNLGVSYEKKGELDAALEQYAAASKKLPLAYLYMGNVYFQKNEIDRAEEAYKNALKKTDDPRAYNNLAWLYYTSGRNLDEAEKLARRAVALNPDADDFRDTLQKIMEKRSRAHDGSG